MSTAELWDYMQKVLVRDGKDPPKIEKLGTLLNLSERTAKNVLWDVIIQSPTQVNSFIDRLIAEELERAERVTRCPIQTQSKKRKLDYELQEHLSRLGLTSKKMPTAEMANDAYKEAMTLDAIQLYEGIRVTLEIDEIAKLRRESDERREAYTNSFMYIKAAIHAKTTLK